MNIILIGQFYLVLIANIKYLSFTKSYISFKIETANAWGAGQEEGTRFFFWLLRPGTGASGWLFIVSLSGRCWTPSC